MTPQTIPFQASLVQILFTLHAPIIELVIDTPPDECVRRLLTLSRGGREVRITALDKTQGYDFNIKVYRYYRGKYTSSKYNGFIVIKDDPDKSFVWYEHRSALYPRFLVALNIFLSFTFLFAAIRFDDSRLTTAVASGLALFGAYVFLREIREDYRLGARIFEALHTVPAPSTK